ncbi:helix-turn-helix domain-containing protein [Rhodococcus sp. RDE2]|uniref:helix-turn-helix domain-containing protein n=1 Tax=Rhodococcus sp. RDE2 TaxID=2885078 RepID=UPI001E4375FD|nr:hypothetical protein [Rhodococcus sp. RDE2]BDB59565.1 hypothetical protein RDE2_13590 [Rhodococcus sp. RDE2]
MTNHLTRDGEYALAGRLAEEFVEMVTALKSRARKLGISPQQIADHLDWSLEDVHEVESPFGDPSISMLQDYARATGAMISIEVSNFTPRSQATVSAGSVHRSIDDHPRPHAEWKESAGTPLVLR